MRYVLIALLLTGCASRPAIDMVRPIYSCEELSAGIVRGARWHGYTANVHAYWIGGDKSAPHAVVRYYSDAMGEFRYYDPTLGVHIAAPRKEWTMPKIRVTE